MADDLKMEVVRLGMPRHPIFKRNEADPPHSTSNNGHLSIILILERDLAFLD